MKKITVFNTPEIILPQMSETINLNLKNEEENSSVLTFFNLSKFKNMKGDIKFHSNEHFDVSRTSKTLADSHFH